MKKYAPFLFAILFNNSCKRLPTNNAAEYDKVTIPFLVFTSLSNTDSAFHNGTFALYDYWLTMDKEQQTPTGYRGFAHFNDTSFYKIRLGFNPYNLQSIYEIPIHIERSVAPYIASKDKSASQIKISDHNISFMSLNAHKWATLKILIYATHTSWQ